jgi:hypothetical protein
MIEKRPGRIVGLAFCLLGLTGGLTASEPGPQSSPPPFYRDKLDLLVWLDVHVLQTEKLAAIAPRPFYIHAPQSDDNFRLASVKRCVQAATAVYALFGAGDGIVTSYPPGGHGFPPEDREEAYRFIDKALRMKRPLHPPYP